MGTEFFGSDGDWLILIVSFDRSPETSKKLRWTARSFNKWWMARCWNVMNVVMSCGIMSNPWTLRQIMRSDRLRQIVVWCACDWPAFAAQNTGEWRCIFFEISLLSMFSSTASRWEISVNMRSRFNAFRVFKSKGFKSRRALDLPELLFKSYFFARFCR